MKRQLTQSPGVSVCEAESGPPAHALDAAAMRSLLEVTQRDWKRGEACQALGQGGSEVSGDPGAAWWGSDPVRGSPSPHRQQPSGSSGAPRA